MRLEAERKQREEEEYKSWLEEVNMERKRLRERALKLRGNL